MEIRSGCDLVLVSRFEKTLQEQPNIRGKLFSVQELEDDRVEHLAGIFAAKEAVLKAIGFKADAWLDFEIKKKPSGEPFVEFIASKPERITHIHISISHDGDYAMAIAVAQLSTEV